MKLNVLTKSFLPASRAALWTLCLLLASVHTTADAQNIPLEVITLKHRTAEQLIPVLQPLVPKPGSVSGLQNQLVIRTTPANLAELKRLLVTLDSMPRRLLITVRQNAALDRDRGQAEVAGQVSSTGTTAAISGQGNAASGMVEAQHGDDVARGRIDSTRSLGTDRNTQTLQVLEGNRAFIQVGQSVPLPQYPIVRTMVNGRLVERIQYPADYRDVVTGFHVLPRLAGDSVTLEISQQRDTLANPEQNLARDSINVQSAATTVSGRLGEWIELGALAQGISNQQSAILGSTRASSTDNWRILIKVDEIR